MSWGVNFDCGTTMNQPARRRSWTLHRRVAEWSCSFRTVWCMRWCPRGFGPVTVGVFCLMQCGCYFYLFVTCHCCQKIKTRLGSLLGVSSDDFVLFVCSVSMFHGNDDQQITATRWRCGCRRRKVWVISKRIEWRKKSIGGTAVRWPMKRTRRMFWKFGSAGTGSSYT